MKNTIIVQKNMKSLLTAKFCDNYLLDVQALILMFAGKEIITSKIEIRSSKIKITVKVILSCLHRLGVCFTRNWLMSWAMERVRLGTLAEQKLVWSNQNKFPKIWLVIELYAWPMRFKTERNSFSVKSLRKPTFSFEILFNSQFNFWNFEVIWKSVGICVVKLSGTGNQCFDGETSFLNNQLVNELIYTFENV